MVLLERRRKQARILMHRNVRYPPSSSILKTNGPISKRKVHRCQSVIFRKKSVLDGRKSGKNRTNVSETTFFCNRQFTLVFFHSFDYFSDDVKKRYEQQAVAEKQKYEVKMSEYKKSGGGASSPAKGGKATAKASSSKKPAAKGGSKKAPAKSKSSDEDNDDDDDDDEDEE